MEDAIFKVKDGTTRQEPTFDKPADSVIGSEEEYATLIEYLEYLSDPAAWFVEKEHPCLDG